MADFNSTKWLMWSGVAFFVLAGAVMLTSIRTNPDYRTSISVPADLFPGFTALTAPKPTTGIVVTSLESSGPAERAGIQVGDIIVAIDNRPVGSVRQARAIIQHVTDPALRLQVLHNDTPVDIDLVPDKEHGNGA